MSQPTSTDETLSNFEIELYDGYPNNKGTYVFPKDKVKQAIKKLKKSLDANGYIPEGDLLVDIIIKEIFGGGFVE